MKPMPITGYDGEAILEYYDRRPLQVGWRLNSLGLPLLGKEPPPRGAMHVFSFGGCVRMRVMCAFACIELN